MDDTDSEIRLFVDDCTCYRKIHDIEDIVKLQIDIDRLGKWARNGHEIPAHQNQYDAVD